MTVRSTRRIDIKKLLSDPSQRKALMVDTIIATQVWEGVEATREQASAAYGKVQTEKEKSWNK